MPELFKVEKQFKLFEDIFPFSLEKTPRYTYFLYKMGAIHIL